MILLDAAVHYEHVQVIRSGIGHESAKKCRDGQNEKKANEYT
jgi:hypothetical protein